MQKKSRSETTAIICYEMFARKSTLVSNQGENNTKFVPTLYMGMVLTRDKIFRWKSRLNESYDEKNTKRKYLEIVEKRKIAQYRVKKHKNDRKKRAKWGKSGVEKPKSGVGTRKFSAGYSRKTYSNSRYNFSRFPHKRLTREDACSFRAAYMVYDTRRVL